jgi:hypothetical protein
LALSADIGRHFAVAYAAGALDRPQSRKAQPFYDELIAEYLPTELRW